MTPEAAEDHPAGAGRTDADTAGVPRGTSAHPPAAPPPPPVAVGVFGNGLDQAVSYAELLATAGVERGLLGPREVARLWERHLLNCAVIAPVFGSSASVLDVGSGAGLPGVVLAIARPDLRVMLLEPLLRRVDFLTEAVAALRLPNVEVLRARAEDVHDRPGVDAVTARAVAPLDRLVRWCAPLVRAGGELVVLKGRTAEVELTAAAAVLEAVDARGVRVEELGAGVLDQPARIVRCTVGRPRGLEQRRRASRPRRVER